MAKLDSSQEMEHTDMYIQKEVWLVILGMAYKE